MKTTLHKIRSHQPCTDGWKKLLQHLGKTEADDESLSLLTILDSNGLDNALWCLRAVEGYDKEIRLYAVWCARQVQHLIDNVLWCLRAVEGYDKKIRLYAVWCARQVQHFMKDPRSLNALDVSEAFANGLVTKEELAAAWSAVQGAAQDVAWSAAWSAAWAASGSVAGAGYVIANAASCNGYKDALIVARAAQEKKLREMLEKLQ